MGLDEAWGKLKELFDGIVHIWSKGKEGNHTRDEQEAG